MATLSGRDITVAAIISKRRKLFQSFNEFSPLSRPFKGMLVGGDVRFTVRSDADPIATRRQHFAASQTDKQYHHDGGDKENCSPDARRFPGAPCARAR